MGHESTAGSGALALAAAIRRRLPSGARPRVGLVLGSGLGAYADRLRGAVRIPYRELPGFPVSGVVGHAGTLVYGEASGVEVLAMQGRVHSYEGYDLATVALPVRALIACGCEVIVLTNAAGSLDPALPPGTLVLLRDHLNLLGGSPLRGPNDDRLGPRFPDMTQVYDPALRALAEDAARSLGFTLPSGVYAGCLGPQYETPSEIRMLRTLGADLVGMSTVPEAIAARHQGARVLGISCVTNLAAGLSGGTLSHDEVTETAARVRERFLGLLDALLDRVRGTLPPLSGGERGAGEGPQASSPSSLAVEDAALIAAAREAQGRAYAPYSRFPVGAAVRLADGRIITGANVENASYGLTLCAERTALSQVALLGGPKAIAAIAVVSNGKPPAAPCGMCRQTLAEFAADCPILLAGPDEAAPPVRTTLTELLPRAFRPSDLLG